MELLKRRCAAGEIGKDAFESMESRTFCEEMLR